MGKLANIIKNKLIALIHAEGITEADLARATNIPPATINRLMLGNTPDPRISTLKAIADYFNIPVDQLYSDDCINQPPKLPKNIKNNLPELSIENIKNKNLRENIFYFILKDEAMWPQFNKNTILIIDLNKKPKNRDFIVAHDVINNQLIFRQFFTKPLILKAINPIFTALDLNLDPAITIMGVLIEARNRFD